MSLFEHCLYALFPIQRDIQLGSFYSSSSMNSELKVLRKIKIVYFVNYNLIYRAKNAKNYKASPRSWLDVISAFIGYQYVEGSHRFSITDFYEALRSSDPGFCSLVVGQYCNMQWHFQHCHFTITISLAGIYHGGLWFLLICSSR